MSGLPCVSLPQEKRGGDKCSEAPGAALRVWAACRALGGRVSSPEGRSLHLATVWAQAGRRHPCLLRTPSASLPCHLPS